MKAVIMVTRLLKQNDRRIKLVRFLCLRLSELK